MKSSFPKTVKRAREQRATIALLKSQVGEQAFRASRLERKLFETERRLKSLLSVEVSRNVGTNVIRLCVNVDLQVAQVNGRVVWDMALEELRRGIEQEARRVR